MLKFCGFSFDMSKMLRNVESNVFTTHKIPQHIFVCFGRGLGHESGGGAIHGHGMRFSGGGQNL